MLLIVFGRATQFFLALITVRVATTFLSPEEMGRVSLVLTTAAFFALFLINPVGVFINRRLHAWQVMGVAKYYLIRYVIYLLLVVFAAIIILPISYKIGLTDFGLSMPWLIFLVCGSLLFNTINQTSISSLNLLGDRKRYVFYSLATVVVSLACATLLIEMVHRAAQYWVLGILAGQTILAVAGSRALFVYLERKKSDSFFSSARIEKQHLRALFVFAWPVAIAAGLAWVQGQGYRYLMETQLGVAQLGLFVAGYGISAGMLAGFESILTTYFQPRLYRDVSDSQPDEQARAWHRYAAAVIPSLLLTVALIAMLAPELTRMLLGERFQSATPYVMWGAFAEAGRVLVGVYSLIAHVYMRTRWLIIPNLIGAILAISLCMLFVPDFGASGIGMGLALSGLAMAATMHILLARKVGGGIPLYLVLVAIIFAMLLWGVTIGLRQLLETTGWGEVITTLVLIGIAYSGMQYMFLRPHLKEAHES